MLKKIYIMAENIDEFQLSIGNVKIINEISEIDEDTLVITDDDSKVAQYNLGVPILGYGKGYRGQAKYVVEDVEAINEHFLMIVYQRFYKLPVTILETQRLLIREITPEDLPSLYQIYTPDVTEYIDELYEYNEELEFTKKYIENMYGFYGYGLWLVFLKETGELIGRMGLENREIDGETQVELGYMLGEKYQHKGYAMEGCEQILEYAREELGVEDIYLCTSPENEASLKLAHRLNFELFASTNEGMNIFKNQMHS